MVSGALQAVDAYTENQRVVGNSLMAGARQHVEAVDELLGGLVARLQSEAQTAREGAVEQARKTVVVAIAMVVLASVLGLLLTVVIVRSITRPARAPGQRDPGDHQRQARHSRFRAAAATRSAPWPARSRCSATAWRSASA